MKILNFVYFLYRGKSGFAKALGLLSLSLDICLMGYLMEINNVPRQRAMVLCTNGLCADMPNFVHQALLSALR